MRETNGLYLCRIYSSQNSIKMPSIKLQYVILWRSTPQRYAQISKYQMKILFFC
nr:MAG TPA: hypothetical protein [Caudoviricetes sp.]